MFKGAAMICLFLQRRLARLDESGEKSRGTYLFNICQCEKKCTEHFVITSFSVGAGAGLDQATLIFRTPSKGYTDKMYNNIIANDKTTNDKMSNGQNA